MSWYRFPAAVSISVFTACWSTNAPVQAPRNLDGAPREFLVWSVTGDREVTRWLDANGHERGRADGIWMATGDALRRVESTVRAVPTAGCEPLGADAPQPGTAELTDLRMLGGGEQLSLATGPEVDDNAAETTHTARVVAGLGRYVFVEESTYEFACGAHGSSASRARVFDLATRTTVGPWVKIADLGPLADTARGALAVRDPAPENDEDLGELHLAQTLPAWNAGRLAVRHLVWVDACYACGNGAWSSYTAGTWISDRRVPPPLAREAAMVPAPVARAVSTSAPSGVSGGAPSSTWASTFRAP
ncbi:MAG: hypothetical protein SFX73_26345 [Kofleriaceae bacterium]|nr:hypothetical protein [Kofleriaceae bacterium]